MKKQLEQALAQKKNILLIGTFYCGKTTLVLEFAKQYGKPYLYLDLEIDHTFVKDLQHEDPQSVLGVNPSSTRQEPYWILDHAECLSDEMLLRLLEVVPGGRLILVTNRLTIAAVPDACCCLTLQTMSLGAFLERLDKQWYVDILKAYVKSGKEIPRVIAEDILECFYDYLLVGGYPLAVEAYRQSKGDLSAIKEAHKTIYARILSGMLRDCGTEELSFSKLMTLWRLFGEAGAKDGYVYYNQIRRGAQRAQYEAELSYLKRQQLIFPLMEDEGTAAREVGGRLRDIGLYQLFCGSYDVFLTLNWQCIPREYLVHYLQETRYRYHGSTTLWKSKRGNVLPVLAAEKTTAVDILQSGVGKGRLLPGFFEQNPNWSLLQFVENSIAGERTLFYPAMDIWFYE